MWKPVEGWIMNASVKLVQARNFTLHMSTISISGVLTDNPGFYKHPSFKLKGFAQKYRALF